MAYLYQSIGRTERAPMAHPTGQAHVEPALWADLLLGIGDPDLTPEFGLAVSIYLAITGQSPNVAYPRDRLLLAACLQAARRSI